LSWKKCSSRGSTFLFCFVFYDRGE